MNPQPTAPVGLYDPRNEHDSCGVGFVADLEGRATHANVRDGLRILGRLSHRGAVGADPDLGDGAGALLQLPHRLFVGESHTMALRLPAPGEYGVAMLFLAREPSAAKQQSALIEAACRDERLQVLGWRDVPTRPETIAAAARASQPTIRQLFVGWTGRLDAEEAERRLYLARRRIERAVSEAGQGSGFYVASFSSRTVVYKGMLTATQLEPFFPDLGDERTESAIVLVHSRFSTNTFPNWARAHPYRMIAHNGEINTLRGNVNAMRARQPTLASPVWGRRLQGLFPILDEDGSDSAIFDNMLEFLVRSGRTLAQAIATMVPQPWEDDEAMDPALRAFYEYQGLAFEPWDGPASISFTDGVRVGTRLDRNGLRPARYWVLDDRRVVLSSETGVLDVPVGSIVEKGRVRPGEFFLVDTAQRRIVPDREIKAELAEQHDYRSWLARNVVGLTELAPVAPPAAVSMQRTEALQRVFGYTMEDLRILLPPMTAGAEAIGSMGTDTPLAVLSRRPQLLYSYFKQLFAQVTNPPIDGVREDLVMSMRSYLGARPNGLPSAPGGPMRIRLESPILSNDDVRRLRANRILASATVKTLFPAVGGDLTAALQRIRHAAERAIDEGATLLVLSDRDADETLAPVPALLAASSVHHHLLACGKRAKASLVVESGEPREVHHFALLLGYGADAVNPFLAIESLAGLVDQGLLPAQRLPEAESEYLHAADKGVMKVLTKMGISTLQGYQGAQVFEALGLGPELVSTHFAGTASRLGGIGLTEIADEVRARHARAYPDGREAQPLESVGEYQFRSEGQIHLFDPETVHRLQHAVRTGDFRSFQEYSRRVDDRDARLCTLRGLLDFRPAHAPVALESVESVESIVRRFKTGAMSYGSISQEAHETLAIAMNRLGGKSNTGEGGEDPARYKLDPNGDSRNSAIKQVASARFGVTSEYLVNAKELQIKMAQGAKPGEGGQLPGSKVYPWIARVRHSTPGVGLISPPPHHDIYSIEDLAQLIRDLKAANDSARVSVKLVAEVGVGTVAAGVAKARADVILISGHDGGTGASPLTSIKHAGVPWELGLAEAQQTLRLNGLRDRVVLETDGQLKTGRDVVIAALLGADEFGFATAPLVSIGCIMMRVCHLNTCPVGVATQDPDLRKRFQGKPEHVENFMRFIAQEVREIMARLGVVRFEDLVGRTEWLAPRSTVPHGIDLAGILNTTSVPTDSPRRNQTKQPHEAVPELDALLLERARPALDDGRPTFIQASITNSDRSVGTRLGSEVTRRWGGQGLPQDTIEVRLTGSAGQSLGAFVPRGITMLLEGDANDYFGKGLSGGKLVALPPAGSTFDAAKNVIVGNVTLYGATSGEAYILGAAGERFAVRNSGASAVVETIGDHGCEYMTGGRVVVLGPVGRNFAAGMSGGIAYVFDELGHARRNCNMDMVSLSPLEDADDERMVRLMLRKHHQYTGSPRAAAILGDWDAWRRHFVRILPHDYARVLEVQRQLVAQGRNQEEAAMEAFALNTAGSRRA